MCCLSQSEHLCQPACMRKPALLIPRVPSWCVCELINILYKDMF